MNIALWITNKIQKLIEIKIMRLHNCKFQYNQINQMCDHNQNNIEICSAQQVRIDRKLLYTENWHFEMHVSWHACWACTSYYTKFTTLCWSHITMCWSQYHSVTYESCQLVCSITMSFILTSLFHILLLYVCWHYKSFIVQTVLMYI